MREVTYKLTKDNGIEYPARFKGVEISYMLPETLDEFRANRIADGANADSVIMGAINGQGLSLTIQKSIKDFFASEKVNGRPASEGKEALPAMSDEEAIAAAKDHAASFKLGEPRKTGEGRKGRNDAEKAKLQNEVDDLKAELLDSYREAPKSYRAKLRERLVAKGRVTAEELDAIDAEG